MHTIIFIFFISFLLFSQPVLAKNSKTDSPKQGSREAMLQKKEEEIRQARDSYKTGVLKTYYNQKSKKIKSEQSYVRGVLHGSSKTYYENGKLKSEGSYIKGKKEGVFKTYFETGKIKTEELYADGVQIDKRLYDEKGKLISITRQ